MGKLVLHLDPDSSYSCIAIVSPSKKETPLLHLGSKTGYICQQAEKILQLSKWFSLYKHSASSSLAINGKIHLFRIWRA